MKWCMRQLQPAPSIRALVFAALLLCGSGAIALCAEPLSLSEELSGDARAALFQSANDRYEQGAYEEAITAYERLVAAGVKSTDLHYNLANAYFKQGDMGRSVLNYERALRLSPRDRDARSNLLLVRTLLKDKQFVKNQLWIARVVTWLQRNMNVNEALLLTSLIYVVFTLIAIGFLFYDTVFVTTIHSRLFAFSPGRLLGLMPRHDFALALVVAGLVFCAAGGLSIYKVMETSDRSSGVIVDEEVPVFSAPSEDSVLQFKIHGGTRVKLQENRAPWARINLPGGLSGWIPAGSAEII